MERRRGVNGKFIADKDEHIEHLRCQLLIARNKLKFYEEKCKRLERRLQNERRLQQIKEM